jgi:hypothetical protein
MRDRRAGAKDFKVELQTFSTITGGTEDTVSRSMVSTLKSKTKIDVSVTSVSCHK